MIDRGYIEAPGTEGPPIAWWFYEDHKYSVKRLIAAAGFSPEEITLRGVTFDEMRAGCWNPKERFFQKHDLCRVMKNASIGLGHYGLRCPEADLAHTFTLVDRNGIHATALSFCRCTTPDGRRRGRVGRWWHGCVRWWYRRLRRRNGRMRRR